MRQEAIEKGQRVDIPYFEGINGAVGHVLAKKTELAHAENARSKVVGTIEKREGQTITGTTTTGTQFYTSGNYSLAYFENGSPNTLYRISQAALSNLSITINETVVMMEALSMSGVGTVTAPLNINVTDRVTITESVMDGIANTATIYYLATGSNYWTALTSAGAGIPAAKFSHVIADGNLFLVNGYSNNRYIGSDGTTVTDSSTGGGHLFNSPNAKKIAFYKNRLYLGNFKKDFEWYKTTVLRSSYPLGIVALVNADDSAFVATDTLSVTDTKYFFADSGANSYEIWRGVTKICGFTINLVNELTVTAATVTHPTTGASGHSASILASDEIWIAGTYTGKKIFRWASNPTSGGKDVKLYDTFKLTGGDNDELKMMTTVGDVLMLGNNNSLATWNDYTLVTHDVGVGCVSLNGYVKSYGSLFFIHYTGVYSTSGGIPTMISQKVQRYIDGATKTGLENAAAGKKGKSVFFKIGTVTLYAPDGSVEKTLYDVALEYSIPDTNWYLHTNVKGDQFETYRTSSNFDMLEMTDDAGAHSVKQFLDSTVTTDDGVEIPFRADMNDLTLQSGAFENINNPFSISIEADRGAGMEAFVRVDRNKYYKLDGDVRKGVSTLKVHGADDTRGKPPVGRLFGVSIRDSSRQICKLDRLAVFFTPGLIDENNQ
jgi:hypothetical protein